MKVGIIPVNIGVESVEQIVGLAKLAESLRYESVWTFEHVIVPIDYEKVRKSLENEKLISTLPVEAEPPIKTALTEE